jgi:uncharacterized protein
MFVFDPIYFVFVLPALLLSLWAQSKVKGAYSKYSRVPTRNSMTGAQVARQILNSFNLSDVEIEQVPGNLSDHYDPRTRVLRLSPGVYQGRSLASAGIAAHEVGHAIQHGQGYAPLHLRSAIYPLASFGSGLAMPLFFIGLLLSTASLGPILMQLGIVLFAGSVLFTFITLPVEFDASSRAMKALEGFGYLDRDELSGARKVLNAAAWTYVAAALMAVTQLLYMVFRAND